MPRRFAYCRGRRTPAGCCATCDSRMDEPCLSIRARCCARRWRTSATISSSPGWKSSSTSSASRRPICARATPPDVELLTTGYQYLTEQRYDLIDPVVQILREGLEKLALPLRSFEVEFGPSQFEFTLAPLPVSPAPMPWCCCEAR